MKSASLVASAELVDEFRAAAKDAYGWGGVQRATEEAMRLWLAKQRGEEHPRAWLIQDPADRHGWVIVMGRSKEEVAQRVNEYVSPVQEGAIRAYPLCVGDLFAFHMELETVELDSEGKPVRVPDIEAGYLMSDLMSDQNGLWEFVEDAITTGPRTTHHISSHGERHVGTDERDDCLECSPWREDLRMARDLRILAQNVLDPEAAATDV